MKKTQNCLVFVRYYKLLFMFFVFSLVFVIPVFSNYYGEDSGRQLQKYGIIYGAENNNLLLDKKLNRVEMAAILVRLNGRTGELDNSDSFTGFADDSLIPKWGKKYVALAKKEKWMQGDRENKFNPHGEITGEELAIVLLRLLGYETTDWGKNIIEFKEKTGIGISTKKGSISRAELFEILWQVVSSVKTSKEDYILNRLEDVPLEKSLYVGKWEPVYAFSSKDNRYYKIYPQKLTMQCVINSDLTTNVFEIREEGTKEIKGFAKITGKDIAICMDDDVLNFKYDNGLLVYSGEDFWMYFSKDPAGFRGYPGELSYHNDLVEKNSNLVGSWKSAYIIDKKNGQFYFFRDVYHLKIDSNYRPQFISLDGTTTDVKLTQNQNGYSIIDDSTGQTISLRFDDDMIVLGLPTFEVYLTKDIKNFKKYPSMISNDLVYELSLKIKGGWWSKYMVDSKNMKIPAEGSIVLKLEDQIGLMTSLYSTEYDLVSWIIDHNSIVISGEGGYYTGFFENEMLVLQAEDGTKIYLERYMLE